MASRITRNQKDELISTSGRLKASAHTQVPTSPRTFKQEILHKSQTQTSQGAREYHLSSNPHYQISLDEDCRAQYYASVSSHPSRYTSKESDSGNSTPSLDSMAGLHIIAQDPQILIEALSELADHDVEHVVDLPRIIVVGDQSVGKSTLITLLSGVDLPKKSGCCTRCPANIVTKAGETWSCTISLHQKYGYRTPKTLIKDRDVTKNNPFPPWFKQEQVIKEFIKVTDRAKLSEAMEWAQIALLNHNQDYEQFIPGKGQRYLDKNTTTVAEVTPNFVKVEITGPKLLTLSFFDLPGIISNTPTVDQRYLIKVFENIAKSYIQSPNTLIIFAMTMQVEAVLSRAKSLIEEERATDRCMGVLTKPDTVVENDGNNDWEKILSGDEHRLGHGWRVTKQPGPGFQAGEQGYQIQAGEDEKQFFATSELWSVKWKKFEKQCGIPRIQSKISRLLAESIGKSLPDIKVRIANRKNVIIKELKGLPELPNQNVQLHVARLLRNLSQDVQKIMSSQHNSSDTTFHGEWTKLSRQFHELILHNKPKITLSDPSDILKVQIINLDDDDGDDDHVPVPGGHVQIVGVSESNKKCTHSQIATDKDPAPATPSSPAVKSGTPTPRIPKYKSKPHSNPFINTIFENHAHYGKGFTSIGKIRRKIENHTYMGLPDMVNAPVYEYFCEKAVSDWQPPTRQLLLGVISILRSEIGKIVQKILGPYQQTGLYRESTQIIENWIQSELLVAQGDVLDSLYKLETYSPFTTNQEDIQKRKEDEKSDLQRIRHRVRAIRLVEKEIYCNPKKMKTKPAETDAYLQEKKKLVEQVTPEQLGKDSFQNEIDVAAYIRGYYVVAASRYIGSVCLSINNRLFRHVKENIEDLLESKLGTNNPVTGVATCQQLMEENDEVGARRRKLQAELKKLDDFEVRFEKLLQDLKRPKEDESSYAGA
ncbi:hypothetical protein EYC80_009691 [Monilinia laxa]|uniref:GED domain-containing protein n=1 Tax=Monilinia laxa TaxID=61186 RepID=A0A5N6JYM3_MONLA|nr:hypothetical protein EYC80_009691 [Monilinia laxa]